MTSLPTTSVPEQAFQRTAFQTSRLLDFVSEKELTLQCGYGPPAWPLVALKELVDNALDACEEHGTPPEITVTIDESTIAVADNGPGIPPDVVDRLLDFSIRVSSREAYVAPDRGAQGNALKTLVAMPFVLDGEQGHVDIQGAGSLTKIAFSVDRIRQQPIADVVRTPAKTGSLVRIHWPAQASSLADYSDLFLQVAADFTVLNPHLTLTVDWFGDTQTTTATTPNWHKWVPSSPTSPHWYRSSDLERLIAAYITHDADTGRQRTVREFISEFKGLTSTIKQKAVLAEAGLSRAPLAALAVHRDLDHEKIAQLLSAMTRQTKPVNPAALGVIGRNHIKTRFSELGVITESFKYTSTAAFAADGLPQVTEVAFGALSDSSKGHSARRLISGVNWSASWVNPFRTLGEYGDSLDSWLADAKAGRDEPIAILVHVAHPRVQYTDRGKSTVQMHG